MTLRLRPRNPFVVAECVAGIPINWRALLEPEKLMLHLLGVTRKQLFSPGDPRSWMYAARGAEWPFKKPLLPLPFLLKDLNDQRREVWKKLFGSNAGRWQPLPLPGVNQGASWFEIRQGSFADCYLIASLSALTWWTSMKPAVFDMQVTAADDRVSATFRDGTTITTSRDVPVLGSSNAYLSACTVDGNEGWPSVLEKAFLLKRRPNLDANRPTYAELNNLEDPAATLDLFHGNVVGPLDFSLASTWSKLVGACLNEELQGAGVLDTFTSIDPKLNPIAACHAYTLLGVMNANEPIVVVRDPFAVTSEGLPAPIAKANAALDKSTVWGPVRRQSGGVYGVPKSIAQKLFQNFALAS